LEEVVLAHAFVLAALLNVRAPRDPIATAEVL
jgi:hypothetical protein